MLNKPPKIITLTFVLLFIILFFYGLIVAKGFLSTLILGIIFSYLIFPLVKFLENKAKFPRVLATLLSIILLLGVLTLLVFVLYRNISRIMLDMPDLVDKAHYNIDLFGAFVESNFGYTVESQNTLIHDSINNLFNLSNNFTGSLFRGTTNTLFTLGLMPVFMYYMIYFREKFFKFILMAIPAEKEQDARNVIRKISLVTPRYIGGVFTVVLVLTVLNSFGLWIVGVKYAILFGIISALFNLIPYFGTWIGASVPFMFALLTGDSPHLALGVILLFIIIQFTENNILTPNITGSYVNLNPFFTILIIIIGGSIWGIIGMFVVVPVAAMLKIIFDHSKSMKPYAYLMGADLENRKKAIWRQKLIIKSKRTIGRF